MNKKIIITFLVLLLIIGMASIALRVVSAQTRAFSLDWSAIGSGGMGGSSGDYTIYSTFGQPVAGTPSSGSTNLISGFWTWVTEAVSDFLNFLPVIFH